MLAHLNYVFEIRIEDASSGELVWRATKSFAPEDGDMVLSPQLERRALREISKYLEGLPERRSKLGTVAPGYYVYISGQFFEIKIEGFGQELPESLEKNKKVTSTVK